MARRDYYEILGVSPDATAEGIRAAYRRKVKELHPDRAGEEAVEAFRELQEAYEVLADARRRQEYDRERQRARPVSVQTGQASRSSFPSSPAFRDASWERFWRSVTGTGRGGSGQRTGALGGIEVILTPEEAARGTRLELDLPVRFACPQCEFPLPWDPVCPVCQGRRWFERELAVTITVPGGVVNGDRLLVTVGPGLQVELQIRVARSISYWW